MKKEIYKDSAPKPVKDVDAFSHVHSQQAALGQNKIKPQKLPDLRDIDDFESLLGESKESADLFHKTDSPAQSEPTQGKSPELQSAERFGNHKDQGNDQRRSAGLDIFSEARPEDQKTPALAPTEAGHLPQVGLEEAGSAGWETYEIELPSLGPVSLSLRTDATGLCFRLSTANPAIETLLSERTQKIERQLGDILKKKVRFMGAGRS